MNPLIISKSRVNLKVKDFHLLIEDNYHNEKRNIFDFAPNDTKGFDALIIQDVCKGYVSNEAYRWLGREKISVLFLDFRGKITQTVIPSNNNTHGNLRIAQIKTHENESQRLEIARKIIIDKVQGEIHFLNSLGFDNPRITSLNNFKELHDFEATFSKYYFAKIGLWIKENTTFDFKNRQSSTGSGNRPAKDIVNAALNLSYMILESYCRIAVHSVGLLHDIGFVHESRASKESLVYDAEEPFRHLADRTILSILENKLIDEKDFRYNFDYALKLKDYARDTIIQETSNALNMRDIVLYLQSIGRACLSFYPNLKTL